MYDKVKDDLAFLLTCMQLWQPASTMSSGRLELYSATSIHWTVPNPPTK